MAKRAAKRDTSVPAWENSADGGFWQKGKVATVVKHHKMTYVGVDVQASKFVTLALDGSKWVASCLRRFYSRGKIHSTIWMGMYALWTAESYLTLAR